MDILARIPGARALYDQLIERDLDFCSRAIKSWMEKDEITPLLARVSALSLDRKNLCFLPPEIFHFFTGLTYLNLSNNQLSELPIALSRLQSLQTLILNDNPLRSVPAEIAEIGSLALITISEAQLDAFPAAVRANLPLETVEQIDRDGAALEAAAAALD